MSERPNERDWKSRVLARVPWVRIPSLPPIYKTMKLLLTSGGITNQSIAKTLFELVGKKPEETKLVFIPTAANVEVGDKKWLIDNLINLQKLNFKEIDIVDISAVEEKIWRPKLERADVLSALKVVDDKVEVISEGEWFAINK